MCIKILCITVLKKNYVRAVDIGVVGHQYMGYGIQELIDYCEDNLGKSETSDTFQHSLGQKYVDNENILWVHKAHKRRFVASYFWNRKIYNSIKIKHSDNGIQVHKQLQSDNTQLI